MRSTITNNAWNITEWGLAFLRVSSFPIDPSCTFETILEFLNYLDGKDTDKPYLGQIIAVREKDSYNVYIVQSYNGTKWMARHLVNMDEIQLKIDDLKLELLGGAVEDYSTLKKIQDRIIILSTTLTLAIANVQNELNFTLMGVGLDLSGNFTPDQKTNYLKNATSVMSALNLLDSTLKEATSHFEDTINNLDFPKVGGETSLVITSVSQENGQISATAGTITSKDKTINIDNLSLGVNIDGLTIIKNELGKLSVDTSKLSITGDKAITVDETKKIGLKVDTNIFTLDSSTGLQSLLEIKKLPSISGEVNVKEAYLLVGKNGQAIGETIKIYKDSHLKNVSWSDSTQNLTFTYILADGSEKQVPINMGLLILEKEVGDGLLVDNSIVKVKKDSSSDPYLTVSPNGIKLSGIKQSIDRVDSIWGGNPDLVTPTLSGKWTVYKNDNSEVLPTPSFPIEFGFKAKYTGTWKWDSVGGKKNPTRTSGTWGTSLPTSGVASTSFISPNYVTNNTTYSQTVFAPKLGLMVSGLNVVPAKGDDSKTASTSVSFSNRIYYGAATSKTPSESIVKGLTTVLGGRGRTINGITINGNQYYYYAYPKSLGALSTIIQDGAQPILGAFARNELTITNAAGIQVALYVYVSNNPGAFTNNNLKFE